VITVQHRDLPLFDRRAADAAEGLRGLIPNRPGWLGAGMHCLFGFPRGGHYAPAGLLVGQQRQANTAVDLLKSWHDGIANVRNSGVDGR
jgi:hypothetical protein